MRVILKIVVAWEGHFRSHSLDLLDDIGCNRAIVLCLVAERCIDMHVMGQHLIQHVVLALQGKFYIISTQRWVIADWILRHACQERGTGQGQQCVMFVGRLIVIKGSYSGNAVKILVTIGIETKVILYGGLDAKFLSAKRGDVE